MSIRTSLTGASAWTQISAAGPATVQVISPESGVTVEVIAQTASPASGTDDGLAMGSALPIQHFSLTQAIWARVTPTGAVALIAVQPEAT